MGWLGQFFSRRRRYEDVTLSIREHLEEKIDELMDAGISRAEAEQTARREFGNVALVEERSRLVWQWPTLESIVADVRFALRQLKRAPGFLFAVLITIGLGIGANTAVFSLVDRILFHPLPYKDPSRIVLVTEMEPGMGPDELGVAIQEAQDYESRNRAFVEMGTFESTGFNLTDDGQPLRVNAAMLAQSIFPLLGVAPSLGRTFTPEEERYGNDHVVVLSWGLWQSKYGGDAHVLGKRIKLDEKPYTVIGVMPASFRFPFDGKPLSERADLWVPDAIAPSRLNPQDRLMEFGIGLIGRLKPGVSAAQAQTDMAEVAQGFESEHRDEYSGKLIVEPYTHPFAGYSMQKARPLVMLLMAAVACVLLIACANVAGLLLARASDREREMAIRAAVGAQRSRLMRQCLVESLLLAFGGATVGILIAEGLLSLLRHWGPRSLPQLQDAAVSPTVLLFTGVLTIGTGVLFGMIPAWKLSHVAPHASLKDAAPIGGKANNRLFDAIAISEIAMAMVLLIGGGLLGRSFVRLLETPIGFDPAGTFVVRTMFDQARYPDPLHRDVIQRELLERLSQLPGITSVAAASHLPLGDERQIGIRLANDAPDDFHWAANSLVSPGYFKTMGIALVRGRDFSYQDDSQSIPVAIVSQAFVQQYLSGQDPIGQRFQWGDRAIFTIVGVATNVHIAALDADPPPMVYNSMFQVRSGASGRTAFVLRGTKASNAWFPEIQAIVKSADRDLPVFDVTSLSTLVEESLAQRRFTLQLLSAFAVVAVSLAVIGLFGVMSYLVEQREREFGVRMALGADRGKILTIIVRKGLLLGIIGCAAGLLLSVGSTSLLRASLYHVGRFDPLTLLTLPFLLLCVAVLSVFIPARRAASIDPAKAIRSE